MEGQGDLREQGEENQLLGSVSQARKSKCSKFWADPFPWKCMEVRWNAVTCQLCYVCRRLNCASGSNRKCTKPQILLCGSCWCWTMEWRTPSQNVPDICLVVSMWLAPRNFPRKRVQHREEVGHACWIHVPRTKCIYVQDQTHCKLEGQAYIVWYSITCLRSPFTSETDVPWCSSHVIIHWRVIHTNLDLLNYSSDGSFSSSLVLQDLKKELVGLEGLRDSLKPRYNGGVVVLSCRSR